MRTLISEALLAMMALCRIPASAQQVGKPEVPTSQHPQNLSSKSQGSVKRAAEPSAELQRLIKALSGKWSLSVMFEPPPGTPNGVTLCHVSITR